MRYGTMQRRRTGWRPLTGVVTRWHTKGQVSEIPLHTGTCVTVQPCLEPLLWSRVSLLWLSTPPAITIKLPSAVGMWVFLSLNWSLTAVSPLSDMPDRVSLLTPLCFTLATGTKLLLFSEEMYWKCDSRLLPKRCPLRPCPPANCI